MVRFYGQKPLFDSKRINSTGLIELVSLVIVFIIALGFRLPALRRGLVFDEIYTLIYFVRLDSLWQTISTYIEFNNHIAYSIILRWFHLMGAQSDWLVRLPALIFGLASIFALWRLARQWLNREIAVLASLMMAISPEHIQWSVTGRGYTGMLLFSLISCHYYFKMLSLPKRSNIIVYIFANVLAIYFHLYSAWVPVIQIIFLVSAWLWQNIKKPKEILFESKSFHRICISFLAIVILSLVLYLPVLNSFLANISMRGKGEFQELFAFRLLGVMNGGIQAPLQIVLFFIAIIGGFALWQKMRALVIFSVLLLSIPVLITLFLRPFYLFSRFFLFALPFYLLILATGVYRLGLWVTGLRPLSKKVATLPILTLMLLIFYAWINNTNKNMMEDGFRYGVMALKNYPEAQIYCAIGQGAELFQYYSNKPILNPTDLAEFCGWIENHDEIVCLYRKGVVVSEVHQQILKFLIQNAQSEKVQNVIIYCYTRTTDLGN